MAGTQYFREKEETEHKEKKERGWGFSARVGGTKTLKN